MATPFQARAECATRRRFRRIFGAAVGLCLAPMLAGCLLTERPELAIEIPDAYKAAPGAPASAPPTLDWWRGFRSKELTDLIQEAQTSNFDIAVAVARIIQADAASKIASAALYPNANLNASATRTRSSQANDNAGGGGSERVSYTAFLNASYEIDFWGKNRST